MRFGIVVLVAGLAACQSGPSETQRDARLVDAPGFEWSLLQWEDQPKATLMFAPPNSDDIAIEFVCAKASHRVEIQTFNPDTDGTRLYLASGRITRTFAAQRLPPDEFYGDAVVSNVETASDDAVLTAFRRSGEIAKGSPPVAFRSATAEERTRIEKFFADCES